MKTYLIDVEISGSLAVEATNPQAAAARANAVLRAIAKGLNSDAPHDFEVNVGKPIDLAKKAAGVH
jgi:hypothetical protein